MTTCCKRLAAIRWRTAAALCLAALTVGCASGPDHVLFVTKTSLGIDVATDPSSATIGYDRIEGYIGPRFDSGGVPPVAASFQTNGQLLSREVRTLYATGAAAVAVTGDSKEAPILPKLDGDRRRMFFSTGTSMGLKIGFGATAATEFVFGYKRRELSVIPMPSGGEFPSVLASLQNDTQTAAQPSSTEFGVAQLFATGVAAVQLANKPQTKGLFQRRIDQALLQSTDALRALGCLSVIPDDQLALVWRNVKARELFKPDLDDADFDKQFATTAPPATARATYTRYLVLIDQKSADRGLKLAQHRGFVCGLAGR